ncbi:hypothetical protein, partial [Streptomyces sp. NPDC059092]|uniref:hypothetical protein n=1 Tax=Streptomyces sp. NPDC059092 TaxID=3346725 RepID=UPI00368B2C01
GYFRGAGTDVVLLRQDRNPGIRDSTNLSTAQVVVHGETAFELLTMIGKAVRTGEAAWGSTGPVHFSIGGLPDEETARSWAVRLHRVTHEHLRDVLGYYGFVEVPQ